MAPETLHVTLPENLSRYVAERVAEAGFSDGSDYVRELIRADRDERSRQAQERLEALLEEGLDSGDPVPMTAADWEAVRREGRTRIEARKRSLAVG